MVYKVMLIYKRKVGLLREKAEGGTQRQKPLLYSTLLMGGNRKVNSY